MEIQEGRTQSSQVEAPGGSSGAQHVPVQQEEAPRDQEAAPPTSVDGPPQNALHQSPPPSELECSHLSVEQWMIVMARQ
eukprot:8287179-Prorocentrum_lima.AAC.1